VNKLIEIINPFATFLGWVSIGVIVLIFIYAVISELRDRAQAKKGGAE
jgi:hypothetical protein